MRPIRTALLLGLAATALAGAALAAVDTPHVLLVRTPDGGVARVRYVGDIAPKIVFVPTAAAAPLGYADPVAAMFGGAGSPLAMMDRISAAMDARADAMLRQAAALAASAPAADPTAMRMVSAGAMPAGTMRYSFVSTTVNGRTCTRSSRLVASEDGAKPQLISQSSGDCGAATVPAAPTPAVAPAAPRSPAMPIPATAPAAPAPPAKVTPVRLERTPRAPVPANSI